MVLNASRSILHSFVRDQMAHGSIPSMISNFFMWLFTPVSSSSGELIEIDEPSSCGKLPFLAYTPIPLFLIHAMHWECSASHAHLTLDTGMQIVVDHMFNSHHVSYFFTLINIKSVYCCMFRQQIIDKGSERPCIKPSLFMFLKISIQ